MDKNKQRQRRSGRTRARIRTRGDRARLSINRSCNHISAQLISPCGSKVIAAASTMEKVLREKISGHCGNIKAATEIGKIIAERGTKAGIKQVAFDRSGYKFHGRIKALADAAREGGLDF